MTTRGACATVGVTKQTLALKVSLILQTLMEIAQSRILLSLKRLSTSQRRKRRNLRNSKTNQKRRMRKHKRRKHRRRKS